MGAIVVVLEKWKVGKRATSQDNGREVSGESLVRGDACYLYTIKYLQLNRKVCSLHCGETYARSSQAGKLAEAKPEVI